MAEIKDSSWLKLVSWFYATFCSVHPVLAEIAAVVAAGVLVHVGFVYLKTHATLPDSSGCQINGKQTGSTTATSYGNGNIIVAGDCNTVEKDSNESKPKSKEQ